MRSTISFSGYTTHPIFEQTLLGEPKRVAPFELPADLYILTPQQQIALLSVRRSDLCREVVAKLMHSTVQASENDYIELTKRGLIQRQGTRRIVTYLGKRRADRIANEMARELGLHFFTVGHDRLHNRISCTCQWSHHYTAAFHHVARCNAEWMAKHLRDVGEAKASVIAGDNSWIEFPPVIEEKDEYTEVPFQ